MPTVHDFDAGKYPELEADAVAKQPAAERCLREWAEQRAGPGTTHWEDCGVVHPACAALAVLRELDALRRENEAMRRVVDAAVAWWRSTRPVGWGEEAHLQHPLIALKALDAPGLARAVADYVAAKTEGA